MKTPKSLLFAVLALYILLPFSCSKNVSRTVINQLNVVVDSVRLQYVPDSRDDVFDISVSQQEGKPVLQGAISVAEAKTDLLSRARAITPDIIDSIRILPDENLGDLIYAVINVVVADLRTDPDDDAELATQLLLGAPLQLLQNKQDWYCVKTIEGYVARVHSSSFVRMNRQQFEAWKQSSKVIFTDNEGYAYDAPNVIENRISELVFGSLLKWEGEEGQFYHVSYPDGRKAFILKSQSRQFDEWKAAIQLTEESIVEKACALIGTPYLWGGTSVRAMDCSGYVKTIYLQHGVILRRDASQQVKTGIPVDIDAGYDNLRQGDLLFFGNKADENRPERVRHVGIYLGNKQFIHSSGDVHISSFDPEHQDYDESNTKAFIYARRILGAVGTEGIWGVE